MIEFIMGVIVMGLVWVLWLTDDHKKKVRKFLKRFDKD